MASPMKSVMPLNTRICLPIIYSTTTLEILPKFIDINKANRAIIKIEQQNNLDFGKDETHRGEHKNNVELERVGMKLGPSESADINGEALCKTLPFQNVSVQLHRVCENRCGHQQFSKPMQTRPSLRNGILGDLLPPKLRALA